ncbi:MAG: hypothetical protein ACREA9_17570 [Pyrinomonadaceae bacterium]
MLTKPPRKWTKRELRLLGRIPDTQIAGRLGVSRKHVIEKRFMLGIGPAPISSRRKPRR